MAMIEVGMGATETAVTGTPPLAPVSKVDQFLTGAKTWMSPSQIPEALKTVFNLEAWKVAPMLLLGLLSVPAAAVAVVLGMGAAKRRRTKNPRRRAGVRQQRRRVSNPRRGRRSNPGGGSYFIDSADGKEMGMPQKMPKPYALAMARRAADSYGKVMQLWGYGKDGKAKLVATIRPGGKGSRRRSNPRDASPGYLLEVPGKQPVFYRGRGGALEKAIASGRRKMAGKSGTFSVTDSVSARTTTYTAAGNRRSNPKRKATRRKRNPGHLLSKNRRFIAASYGVGPAGSTGGYWAVYDNQAHKFASPAQRNYQATRKLAGRMNQDEPSYGIQKKATAYAKRRVGKIANPRRRRNSKDAPAGYLLEVSGKKPVFYRGRDGALEKAITSGRRKTAGKSGTFAVTDSVSARTTRYDARGTRKNPSASRRTRNGRSYILRGSMPGPSYTPGPGKIFTLSGRKGVVKSVVGDWVQFRRAVDGTTGMSLANFRQAARVE